MRWPLTQPQDFKEASNIWMTAKFIWFNNTINSAPVAWRIYLFDDEGNVNVTDIKIFYVNMPIHNIAITNVMSKEIVIEQNQTMPINVTVMNTGNYTETFNLTLCYDSTTIGFQALTLNPKESRILTFEWNTTGVSYGNYTLSAHGNIIPKEADTEDNTFTLDYTVTVIPEFASTFLIVVFIVFTLIGVILKKQNTRLRINQ